MDPDDGLRAAPLTPEERDYLRGLIEAAPRMDEGSRQVFYRLISYALADAATPTPPRDREGLPLRPRWRSSRPAQLVADPA